MHATKSILVIVVFLLYVPTAYGQDSSGIRYSTSMEISSQISEHPVFSLCISPALEYYVDNDITVLFSPAVGIGKATEVYIDFLLQCNVRYWNDDIKPWYIFSGVSLIKPFSDRILITGYGYYDTHIWHKNIHINLGFGIHGSSLSTEFFWRCPMFPLIDGGTYDQPGRHTYYLLLGAAVRFAI